MYKSSVIQDAEFHNLFYRHVLDSRWIPKQSSNNNGLSQLKKDAIWWYWGHGVWYERWNNYVNAGYQGYELWISNFFQQINAITESKAYSIKKMIWKKLQIILFKSMCKISYQRRFMNQTAECYLTAATMATTGEWKLSYASVRD